MIRTNEGKANSTRNKIRSIVGNNNFEKMELIRITSTDRERENLIEMK